MCYENALSLLKAGQKVCRSGWNGKNMWLILLSKSYFAILHCEQGENPDYQNQGHDMPIGDNGEISHIGIVDGENFYSIGDCICMKSSRGLMELGWKPSSEDMLAEDWITI